MAVYDLIKKGDICIDCGANVGEITYKLAAKGATVHAFEPNPYLFPSLTERFKDTPSVILYKQGVYDKAGTMNLFFDKHFNNTTDFDLKKDTKHTYASSLYGNKSNVSKDKHVAVEVIDIAEFIKKLNTKITLLKLDVEGAEPCILNKIMDAGVSGFIKYLAVEFHARKIPGQSYKVKHVQERLERDTDIVIIPWR